MSFVSDEKWSCCWSNNDDDDVPPPPPPPVCRRLWVRPSLEVCQFLVQISRLEPAAALWETEAWPMVSPAHCVKTTDSGCEPCAVRAAGSCSFWAWSLCQFCPVGGSSPDVETLLLIDPWFRTSCLWTGRQWSLVWWRPKRWVSIGPRGAGPRHREAPPPGRCWRAGLHGARCPTSPSESQWGQATQQWLLMIDCWWLITDDWLLIVDGDWGICPSGRRLLCQTSSLISTLAAGSTISWAGIKPPTTNSWTGWEREREWSSNAHCVCVYTCIYDITGTGPHK